MLVQVFIHGLERLGGNPQSLYETTSEHHQELVPGCLDHAVVCKDK